MFQRLKIQGHTKNGEVYDHRSILRICLLPNDTQLEKSKENHGAAISEKATVSRDKYDQYPTPPKRFSLMQF